MIVIQHDVWRADCIAALGLNKDTVVQVYPLGQVYCVEYEYESRKEAMKDYKQIVAAWKAELEATQATK